MTRLIRLMSAHSWGFILENIIFLINSRLENKDRYGAPLRAEKRGAWRRGKRKKEKKEGGEKGKITSLEGRRSHILVLFTSWPVPDVQQHFPSTPAHQHTCNYNYKNLTFGEHALPCQLHIHKPVFSSIHKPPFSSLLPRCPVDQRDSSSFFQCSLSFGRSAFLPTPELISAQVFFHL